VEVLGQELVREGEIYEPGARKRDIFERRLGCQWLDDLLGDLTGIRPGSLGSGQCAVALVLTEIRSIRDDDLAELSVEPA
jgi:hypothetical protein